MLRTALADKASERVHRGQPLVAGPQGAAPRVFDLSKELPHPVAVTSMIVSRSTGVCAQPPTNATCASVSR
jgi:hypothetical protein